MYHQRSVYFGNYCESSSVIELAKRSFQLRSKDSECDSMIRIPWVIVHVRYELNLRFDCFTRCNSCNEPPISDLIWLFRIWHNLKHLSFARQANGELRNWEFSIDFYYV